MLGIGQATGTLFYLFPFTSDRHLFVMGMSHLVVHCASSAAGILLFFAVSVSRQLP